VPAVGEIGGAFGGGVREKWAATNDRWPGPVANDRRLVASEESEEKIYRRVRRGAAEIAEVTGIG
jgi:hypothetical protein